MKNKKKWKKLRKLIKICRKNKNCSKCEIRDFCNKMSNFAGISIYFYIKQKTIYKDLKKYESTRFEKSG